MRRSKFPKSRPHTSKSKEIFDIAADTQGVKHTRIGVWDLYEERILPNIPGASRLEPYLDSVNALPDVWKMVKDISSIRDCWVLLFCYMLLELALALIPALNLWFSGQLLKIVEVSLAQRVVERDMLFQVAAGRIGSTILHRILQYLKSRVTWPLKNKIKNHYSVHIFRAMARLDVPTFDDPVVQGQLESAWSTRYGSSTVAWDVVTTCCRCISMVFQLASQISVLIRVLGGQRDGPLLAFLSFGQTTFDWISRNNASKGVVWAATTKSADFIRCQGMKRVIHDHSHRKEVIAGNISEHLTLRYQQALERIGDNAGDFWETWRSYQAQDKLTVSSLLREPLRQLPQIVFTLRAVQYPATIPISLASFNLIQDTAYTFSHAIVRLVEETGTVAEVLGNVRKLYGIADIPNQVSEGSEPFPEDQQSLLFGISVEFRNVSFKYPGSEGFALRNVSFRIGQGQLCVIIGRNGSGKSTILKLIARVYEPTEGDILIDGRDIKALKLVDLRNAMSVLFQDYTHFPLSIAENIGLGDPANVDDQDKIYEAAKLGGADEFINRLPEAFATYLDRPVQDHYSPTPAGTKTLFGKPVDFDRLRGIGGMKFTDSTSLSGGQMQRLALSRSFMRSLVSTTCLGLLLFDEPSASLDPTAEHELFEKLRTLRGNKTMIFSSHRLGNLTRHADLILYMSDSEITEEGAHDDLIRKQGEYARIWQLQAQAFL